jgi:hypothetical protein
VRLAARGLREDEQGKEQQDIDKLFDAAAKRQARKVTMLSIATTVAVTAIALAIPPLR